MATFIKRPNPAVLPTGGLGVALGNEVLAVAQGGNTKSRIYHLDTLAEFTAIPPGTVLNPQGAVEIAPGDNMLYMGVSGSPGGKFIYSMNVDPEGFTDIGPLPSSPNGPTKGGFSADGSVFAMAFESSPYLVVWTVSGGVFTRVPNPAVLPAGVGRFAAISPDGSLIAVGHNTSPFFSVYSFNGTTLTKLANPANLPPNIAFSVAISPDNRYVAVGCITTAPRFALYEIVGGVLTLVPGTPTITANVNALAFSPDGNYLGVASGNSFTLYDFADGVMTVSEEVTPLSGVFNRVAFSPDGKAMAVAGGSSPFVHVWEIEYPVPSNMLMGEDPVERMRIGLTAVRRAFFGDTLVFGEMPPVPTRNVFLSSGTFTPPPGVTSVSALIVGGGGGGGGGGPRQGGAGGGGAGRVRFIENITVSPGSSYPIVVGAGGVGGSGVNLATRGGNGGNSSAFGYTAEGGGGGGGGSTPGTGGENGANGGSGGGGHSGVANGAGGYGGTAVGAGGNAGGRGNGSGSTPRVGGGGGGAGQPGASSATNVWVKADGGDGLDFSFLVPDLGAGGWFGGGGGGGGNPADYIGAGGRGGGGNGSNGPTASAGVAGTGGGGGGCFTANGRTGGAGGSGIVVLFYEGTEGPTETEGPTTETEGLLPSGAWSMSRDFFGSPPSRYTEVSGAVSVLFDHTGNGRNFAQSSVPARPAVSTAGPNGRACLVNSVNAYLITDALLSDFIQAGEGYMVASFLPTAINGAQEIRYNNECVVCDSGGYTGLFVSQWNTTPPQYRASAFNWDGNADYADAVAPLLNVPSVLEWKHEGGNISVRHNGGAWASGASGNTQVMTSPLRLGRYSARDGFKGSIFELAVFREVPPVWQQNAIVADMMSWVGV